LLDPEKFEALKTNVQSRMVADGPVFWQDSYTVQANTWFGISGGWTCNILWIFNIVAPKWTEQLPYDVESLLKTMSSATFLM